MFQHPYFMGFFSIPECPICKGEGSIRYDGFTARRCDHCDGQGAKLNVVTTAVRLVVLVTTVGPLLWWIW